MKSTVVSTNPHAVHRPAGNLILSFLPPHEFDRLQPSLESVEMPQGQVLYESSAAIDHVYFVDQGMISVVSVMQDGSSIEVGTIGKEGMVGKSIVLGVESVPY